MGIVWDMVARMRRHGIQELDVHDDTMELRLRLDPAAMTAAGTSSGRISPVLSTAPSSATMIHSPCMGRALLAHPLRSSPEVEPGQNVEEGDIVAFVGVDHILYPVLAPCAGCIGEIKVTQGMVIGYHQPLMLIERGINIS
ncbi:biotin/lipoyl-containing protein [Komagataeibacter rhaeticus]|uniref:acetyl-CoA carboxylase biotin carboxyl carrier protein n=1 Tax=Komagataeibacter rhaeticus TaxID=215221 RepID=UPI002491F0B0|nr:biotin/lipoyl-containing protein [Komagataeibacter rhaeticus]